MRVDDCAVVRAVLERTATDTGQANDKAHYQAGDNKSVLEIHRNLAQEGDEQVEQAISKAGIIKIENS